MGIERTAAVAAAAPAVRTQAAEIVAEAVDQAREHVEALRDLAERVREARSAVEECDTAEDAKRGERVHRESFGRTGPADLIAAVLDGADLLHRRTARRLGVIQYSTPPEPEPGTLPSALPAR